MAITYIFYFEFHFACRLVTCKWSEYSSVFSTNRVHGPVNLLWDRWFEGPQDPQACRCWILWFEAVCQLPCVANRMPHITALKWLWSWRKCLMTCYTTHTNSIMDPCFYYIRFCSEYCLCVITFIYCIQLRSIIICACNPNPTVNAPDLGGLSCVHETLETF